MFLCEHKYSQFKEILSGCRTLNDALYFGNIFTLKNPEMKNIINSMINGKHYENILDLMSIKIILENLDECEYYADAEKIIQKIDDTNNDVLHKSTFINFINSKKYSKYYNKNYCKTIEKENKPNKSLSKIQTKKACPHCKYENIANYDTTYIVCGMSDTHNGYDWMGCYNDWCFKCEKILCKSWGNDFLFDEENITHNGECCKNHAIINNKKYPDEYCQCDDWYNKKIV
jgi:hypothetical protein